MNIILLTQWIDKVQYKFQNKEMNIKNTNDFNYYMKQLQNINYEKQVFQTQLLRRKMKRQAKKQQIKYQHYIKEQLMKTVQITPGKEFFVFNNIQEKFNRMVQGSFFKILVYINKINRRNQYTKNSQSFIKFKQINCQIEKNILIRSENRTQDGITKLLRIQKKTQSKNLKQSFHKIKQQFKLFKIQEYYEKIIKQKDQIILQKDQEMQALTQKFINLQIKMKNAQKMTSNYQATLSTCQQNRNDRLLELEKQLIQKIKQIKTMKKNNLQKQNFYENKIQQLEDQMNKLHFYNLKLTQQIQQFKNHQRPLVSEIKHRQYDNSLSLDIFEKQQNILQEKKQLQAQLSQKYLKQVICLKQNIESIKTILIQIFLSKQQNGEMKNLQKSTFHQLLYLLDFTQNQKVLLKKNKYISQLYF